MSCIALLDLRSEKLRGITLFHAFTGCAVVSAFRDQGNTSAWQTWDMCADASDVFARLSHTPQVATVNDNEVDIMDKCVVMMYKSNTATCVNNAMLDMFARKQRPCQAIQPTQSALLQHVRHAAYQAGCIWSQSTLRQPETESPADWEWARDGDNVECSLGNASTYCRELSTGDQVWMQVRMPREV